jgi:hypothetical protein
MDDQDRVNNLLLKYPEYEWNKLLGITDYTRRIKYLLLGQNSCEEDYRISKKCSGITCFECISNILDIIESRYG